MKSYGECIADLAEIECKEYPPDNRGIHPLGWDSFQAGWWQRTAEIYWAEVKRLRTEVDRLECIIEKTGE